MCIRDRLHPLKGWSLRQTRGGSFPRFRSSSGSVLPVRNSYRNHKRLAYLPVGLDRIYSRRSSSPACAACVAVGRRKNAYYRAAGPNLPSPVSYTHLRAHETKANLVCRLLLEKKKTTKKQKIHVDSPKPLREKQKKVNQAT